MSEPTKEQIEEAREFYRHAADGVVLNAPEGATLETINNEVFRRMALRLAAIRAQATNDTLERAAKPFDNWPRQSIAHGDYVAAKIRAMKVPT